MPAAYRALAGACTPIGTIRGLPYAWLYYSALGFLQRAVEPIKNAVAGVVLSPATIKMLITQANGALIALLMLLDARTIVILLMIICCLGLMTIYLSIRSRQPALRALSPVLEPAPLAGQIPDQPALTAAPSTDERVRAEDIMQRLANLSQAWTVSRGGPDHVGLS